MQTVSSTISDRTQTTASTNPTLDFANEPSRSSWAKPSRSVASSELPSSEIGPRPSAYPSQPDFRSPSGLVGSQQFEGYKNDSGLSMGTQNTSERSVGPVLGEIREGSAAPNVTSADFSTYNPSQEYGGDKALFGINQERLPPSERIVFTSEFSLPKNTERLNSGR